MGRLPPQTNPLDSSACCAATFTSAPHARASSSLKRAQVSSPVASDPKPTGSPRSDTPETEIIVLASRSPRRRQLLERAGIRYVAMPADVDETARAGESPTALSLRLACEKAGAIAEAVGAVPRRFVLGSDTIVVLDGVVFGKPRDEHDAFRLLRELAGRRHRVITGVAVVDSSNLRTWERAVETFVTMRPASDEELRSYVATGEPLDKAGAYAVQGAGRQLVAKIEGSETNVIGLPLEETLDLLVEAGASLGVGR